MNESAAIKRCLNDRDPLGFEFLVRQYRREAYYHAMGFLGDRSEAEDACQESFAKAYAAMPRLRKLPAFYPWFYQILKNGCLNRIRGRRLTEVPSAELPDVSPNPAEILEGDRLRASVWQALNRLKPGFREILIMKHLHDASYDEISQLLAIPRGTVMSRLYHARKAFQKVCSQTGGNT
jgi:RNA polymerase sigma-70 factor, ECF subfamily